MAGDTTAPIPRRLTAELTHRCSLGCPYCCNPLTLVPPSSELDTATWIRVFAEAASLGVRQACLSGGEPGRRSDLVEIVANARDVGLDTSLITSGVGIDTRTMRDLWEAGLQHVNVSFQDSDAVSADRIAGQGGAFQRKHALAVEAGRLGLPLTVSFVMHRANIGRVGSMIDLALALKAQRVEISRVRDVGWATKNRAALLPDAADVQRLASLLADLKARHRERIVIDDTDANERASRADSLLITPSGEVLPGRGDAGPTALKCWNVRDHALQDIWWLSPAFVEFHSGTGSASCTVPPDHDAAQHEARESSSVVPYHHRR